MGRREFLLAAMAAGATKPKLREALKLIESKTASGEVSEAGLLVRGRGERLADVKPDRVFLLASISKPMTASALMLLVDRGELRLDDPVRKFIPEFKGGDRDRITVKHLLTHTSGLPDMLPENTALRKRHAPLSEFVAGTCKTPLLFAPGTKVQYQSMGILLASEIAERITHLPFRELLRREVFQPLGMSQTSLGLGGRKIPQTAQCQVKGDDDWNWNSPYWRDLGAPWGGVHSTATDVTKFLESFRNPDGRVLKRETAAMMVRDQNQGLNEPWGIGWMVKPGKFSKACSDRTFGHYGSTGTVAWADPASGVTCVLLTTKPATESRDGLLGPVSDLVAAA